MWISPKLLPQSLKHTIVWNVFACCSITISSSLEVRSPNMFQHLWSLHGLPRLQGKNSCHAQNADLNPTAHILDELEHWAHPRLPRLISVSGLTNAFMDEGANPPAMCQNIEETLTRRVDYNITRAKAYSKSTYECNGQVSRNFWSYCAHSRDSKGNTSILMILWLYRLHPLK